MYDVTVILSGLWWTIWRVPASIYYEWHRHTNRLITCYVLAIEGAPSTSKPLASGDNNVLVPTVIHDMILCLVCRYLEEENIGTRHWHTSCYAPYSVVMLFGTNGSLLSIIESVLCKSNTSCQVYSWGTEDPRPSIDHWMYHTAKQHVQYTICYPTNTVVHWGPQWTSAPLLLP